MLAKCFQFRTSFHKMKSLAFFSTNISQKLQKKSRNCNIGVCIRIHFHFEENELVAYPENDQNAKCELISSNTDHVKNDAIEIVTTEKQITACMGNPETKRPEFIALQINLKFENPKGELEAGKFYLDALNLGGKVPLSKTITDNMFVYNGKTNCNVKCK